MPPTGLFPDHERGLVALLPEAPSSGRSVWSPKPILFLLLGSWLALALTAPAATSNGNDFALTYTEARTPAAQKAVLDEAAGRPHYFRYLQIMEMQPITVDGQSGFVITAFEPGSYLDVKFSVTSPVSLGILRQDPVSRIGDALAVTAKVAGLDAAKKTILLENAIVRNKDRLSPKMGQELLGEVKPGATFYSYTEGPRPVKLSYQDRDLLTYRDRILAQGGPKAWMEFLEKEIARRAQARAAAAKTGEGASP